MLWSKLGPARSFRWKGWVRSNRAEESLFRGNSRKREMSNLTHFNRVGWGVVWGSDRIKQNKRVKKLSDFYTEKYCRKKLNRGHGKKKICSRKSNSYAQNWSSSTLKDRPSKTCSQGKGSILQSVIFKFFVIPDSETPEKDLFYGSKNSQIQWNANSCQWKTGRGSWRIQNEHYWCFCWDTRIHFEPK